MTWGNPRWQRLLAWGLWRYSPSLMRAPTFREAWTGRVEELWPDIWPRLSGYAVDRSVDLTEAHVLRGTLTIGPGVRATNPRPGEIVVEREET